ncbi:MAG TPA: primosomal protein, partial [Microbacterium sp.]|nr:primosomal protein [Microbacterium sp.]
PDRAFEWSPALFAARAVVLEELGRDDEAREWRRRAEVAADALNAANGDDDDLEVVFVEEIIEEPGEKHPSAHDEEAAGSEDRE